MIEVGEQRGDDARRLVDVHEFAAAKNFEYGEEIAKGIEGETVHPVQLGLLGRRRCDELEGRRAGVYERRIRKSFERGQPGCRQRDEDNAEP